MNSVRCVYLGPVDPAWGMAAERFFLDSVRKGGPNTLLVYSRDRPTVSIGAYAVESECVDLGFVQDNGISIVRRISGGSAIFTGPGQLTYSHAYKRTKETKEEGYARICGYVAKGLSSLGIDARYKPVNDVVCNEKKISGGAQYRDASCVLQHGSVIISLDKEFLDGSLIPLKPVEYTLSSIDSITGKTNDPAEVFMAIVSGFPEAYVDTLSASEKVAIDLMARS